MRPCIGVVGAAFSAALLATMSTTYASNLPSITGVVGGQSDLTTSLADGSGGRETGGIGNIGPGPPANIGDAGPILTGEYSLMGASAVNSSGGGSDYAKGGPSYGAKNDAF